MKPPAPTVVGRLAPSPTGELHLGHARSFLLAWWSARARGGRVLLRWEDIGSERVRAEFIDGNRRDLEWLGLDWDGAEVVQSDGLGGIRDALDALLQSGAVYPCVCSRRELREARAHDGDLDAPHDPSLRVGAELSSMVEPPYPGTCRGRFGTLAEAFEAAGSGRLPALRFDVAGTGAVRLRDRVWGALELDLAHFGGDFVVGRADPGGAHEVGYQVAVVVDDARGGVTEVLRGEDLLISAARQECVARALDLPSPEWAHVPLVTDAAGERLAKRTHALSLEHLRASGVSATDVVRWVASSCGVDVSATGALRAADCLPGFDLARLPRHAVVAPDWLNRG